jgi:hypothetical protein
MCYLFIVDGTDAVFVVGDCILGPEPQYKPNQAAPAPTITDIRPACALFGSGKAINQIVDLYNR